MKGNVGQSGGLLRMQIFEAYSRGFLRYKCKVKVT